MTRTPSDGERTVLITGAASGIGAATARRIAGPGVRLMLHTGSNARSLEDVAGCAREAGAEAETTLGDLTEAAVPARIIGEIEDRYGSLDAIVSNAGYVDWRAIGELDEAGFRASHDVVTGAFFRLATAGLELLKASGQGRIVGVSSFLAHVFQPVGRLAPASAAAKAGMEAIAKSLAVQLAPFEVTVNCVVPGYIEKDSGAHARLPETALRAIPLHRHGTTAEVAAAIAFLLSSEAAYITGQSIHVDGGLSL